MSSLAVRGGDVVVLIDHDRISAIDPDNQPDNDNTEPVLDATGCSVVAGFVDLQVNGAAGVDLTARPDRVGEVAAFLPQTGVTSFMPTVISSPLDDIASAVTIMHRRAGERSAELGARSLGAHIEGPFLNPRRKGAHPERHLRQPSLRDIVGWRLDAGVAMVTIAPELPDAGEVIKRLVAQGVVVCAGHTEADVIEIDAAVGSGLRGVTHLFNAMGGMSARRPGTSGIALTHPTLISCLIVDGLHVDSSMVQLAWRLLGPDRLALVTDSIAALGLPHGTFGLGESPVVVDANGARTTGGVLAGSVLRFDQAVRNLIAYTDCAPTEALRSASETPARLAGRADIGRLAAGHMADVVLLDDAHCVVATVVGGEVVWDPQQRWSRRTGRSSVRGGAPWKS